MGISNEQYERLMRFMDMDMNAVEIQTFEEELNGNAELRARLAFEQSVRDAFIIKEQGERKFMEGIKPAAKKGLINYQWLAAASIVIIVFSVLIYLLVSSSQTKNNSLPVAVDTLKQNRNLVKKLNEQLLPKPPHLNTDSLFRIYYKKEPVPYDYPIALADEFEKYNENDYSGFEKLDVENLRKLRGSSDSTIQLFGWLYKGIAMLEKKKPERAIECFDKVLHSLAGKALTERAYWYKALAYLQKGEANKTAILLKDMKGKAIELLRAINH